MNTIKPIELIKYLQKWADYKIQQNPEYVFDDFATMKTCGFEEWIVPDGTILTYKGDIVKDIRGFGDPDEDPNKWMLYFGEDYEFQWDDDISLDDLKCYTLTTFTSLPKINQ